MIERNELTATLPKAQVKDFSKEVKNLHRVVRTSNSQIEATQRVLRRKTRLQEPIVWNSLGSVLTAGTAKKLTVISDIRRELQARLSKKDDKFGAVSDLSCRCD